MKQLSDAEILSALANDPAATVYKYHIERVSKMMDKLYAERVKSEYQEYVVKTYGRMPKKL